MNNNYTVYMHISPSGKRYIGITKQKVEYRWNNGKGYKNNIHFTNAINKYTWNNFQHIIVARGLTKEEAKWLEIELIKAFDTTNPLCGYNISHGGDTGTHFIGELNPSKRIDVRKKISDSHKKENNPMFGKQHSKETLELMRKNNKNSKKVLCVELNIVFNSTAEANEYLNKERYSDNIGACARGNSNTAWGYHWEYVIEENIDDKEAI